MLSVDEMNDIKRNRVLSLLKTQQITKTELTQLKTHLASEDPYSIVSASILLKGHYQEQSNVASVNYTEYTELLMKSLQLPINHSNLHHDQALACLLTIAQDN